jgi:glucose-6-phosphate isomerase
MAPGLIQRSARGAGVEAGKKAAAAVLELQLRVAGALAAEPATAAAIAARAGAAGQEEAVYLLLEHLTANGRARAVWGAGPGAATFTSP